MIEMFVYPNIPIQMIIGNIMKPMSTVTTSVWINFDNTIVLGLSPMDLLNSNI